VRLWLRADANLRQAVPATAAVPEVLNLRPTRPRRQPLGNGPLSPLHGRSSPRGFAPGMWNVPSLRESQPAFPKGWKPCHQSRSAQRPRWEIRSPRRGRSRLLWAKQEARGTIYAVMSSLGIEVPPVQPARGNRGENRTNSQRCVRSSGSPSGSGRTSLSRRISAHATGKESKSHLRPGTGVAHRSRSGAMGGTGLTHAAGCRILRTVHATPGADHRQHSQAN
jgi:hypothetical protein